MGKVTRIMRKQQSSDRIIDCPKYSLEHCIIGLFGWMNLWQFLEWWNKTANGSRQTNKNNSNNNLLALWKQICLHQCIMPLPAACPGVDPRDTLGLKTSFDRSLHPKLNRPGDPGQHSLTKTILIPSSLGHTAVVHRHISDGYFGWTFGSWLQRVWFLLCLYCLNDVCLSGKYVAL